MSLPPKKVFITGKWRSNKSPPKGGRQSSQSPIRRWWRALCSHPLLLLPSVGAVVVFFAEVAQINQAWGVPWPSKPELDMSGMDAALPLRTPFLFRTRSFIFPAVITKALCEFTKIEPITSGDVAMTIVSPVSDLVLPTWGQSKPFECRVKVGSRKDITHVEMILTVDYAFAWPVRFWASTLRIPLHWTPNHWSQGDIAR